MATQFGAYAGKVLKIDLTTKKTEEYPFSDEMRKMYLGGKIMAAKIMYDYIKGPTDPFSPENIIVITTGPLNGMGSPSSSRFNITSVSPLTGLVCSSNCGGNFGIRLKRAGLDALIITGKSEEKVYIEITDDKVEIKNADHLWGLKTGEAQLKIGGNSGKIVIGPAGENKVLYSGIVSEERIAGRGGLGAVMGSKNLKAVVASGKSMQAPKNKEKFMQINKDWINALKKHPLTGSQLPKLGSAGLLSSMNAKHILATKNFDKGQYEYADDINGELLAEKYLVKNKGCISCPIQCGRVVKVEGKDVKGPELETLGLLGANIENHDMEKILEWNYLLDEYGMDTISFAGTIAFAMELNEKGLYKSGLEFGKNDNISKFIEDIAFRRGEVANQLADGAKRLSEKHGGKEFCIHSKGMELSAYEPRGAVGQGLGYAISNRGGCHLNAGYLVVLEGLGFNINPYTPKGKASLTMLFQDLMESISAGGNCLFTSYAALPGPLLKKPNNRLSRIVNGALPHVGLALYIAGRYPKIMSVNIKAMLPHPIAINAATGMKLNMGKMLRIGERGYNLERLTNIRLGLKGADDALPKRLTEDLQIPDNKKSKVPLEYMKKRYYKCRSWDKNGIPKKGLVRRLKLDKAGA